VKRADRLQALDGYAASPSCSSSGFTFGKSVGFRRLAGAAILARTGFSGVTLFFFLSGS